MEEGQVSDKCNNEAYDPVEEEQRGEHPYVSISITNVKHDGTNDAGEEDQIGNEKYFVAKTRHRYK